MAMFQLKMTENAKIRRRPAASRGCRLKLSPSSLVHVVRFVVDGVVFIVVVVTILVVVAAANIQTAATFVSGGGPGARRRMRKNGLRAHPIAQHVYGRQH